MARIKVTKPCEPGWDKTQVGRYEGEHAEKAVTVEVWTWNLIALGNPLVPECI